MEDRRFKTGFQAEKCSGEEEMKGVWRGREGGGARGNGGNAGKGKGGRYNEVLWVSGGRSHSACQPTQPGSVQMAACWDMLTALLNQEVDVLCI